MSRPFDDIVFVIRYSGAVLLWNALPDTVTRGIGIRFLPVKCVHSCQITNQLYLKSNYSDNIWTTESSSVSLRSETAFRLQFYWSTKWFKKKSPTFIFWFVRQRNVTWQRSLWFLDCESWCPWSSKVTREVLRSELDSVQVLMGSDPVSKLSSIKHPAGWNFFSSSEQTISLRWSLFPQH